MCCWACASADAVRLINLILWPLTARVCRRSSAGRQWCLCVRKSWTLIPRPVRRFVRNGTRMDGLRWSFGVRLGACTSPSGTVIDAVDAAAAADDRCWESRHMQTWWWYSITNIIFGVPVLVFIKLRRTHSHTHTLTEQTYVYYLNVMLFIANAPHCGRRTAERVRIRYRDILSANSFDSMRIVSFIFMTTLWD